MIKTDKINKIYIALLLIILFLLVKIYFDLSASKIKLIDGIENLYILQAKQFSQKMDNEIKKDVHGNLYITLKKDPQLRKKIEKKFNVLISNSFKYIYVLYKTKNNQFKYLLDSSNPKDRGHFDEKLDVNIQKWSLVYKTKKDEVLYHHKLNTLWATYLKPVIIDNRVQGVIAFDFSIGLINKIKKLVKPTHEKFLYIFYFIFVLMLFLMYQVILNAKIKKDSHIDPLTKAYNRSFFRIFLKRIDLSKYQILMIDIDFFKKINDTYGHDAGDKILKEISFLIKGIIRDKDIFIRFGGEEFLIFINKEKASLFIAEEIGERIRRTIEEYKFKYNKKLIKTTVSIGACLNPQKFKTPKLAIKKADELLYIAKNNGRNILVYD